MAEEIFEELERCNRQAMTAHSSAAIFHSQIRNPEHQEASKAHARKSVSFETSLEDHRRMVRHYWPPRNNEGAFDWYVAIVRREREYCDSHADAYWVMFHLKEASFAGNPTLANNHRKKALTYQPRMCGVHPF